MPHELCHERRPDHTGEVTLGAAPGGSLRFEDGIATVAEAATAEVIADRYVALSYVNDDRDGGGGSDSDDDGPPVDPAAFTVAELRSHLDEHEHTPAELDALYRAEADGVGVDSEPKGRQTALDAINAHRPDDED